MYRKFLISKAMIIFPNCLLTPFKIRYKLLTNKYGAFDMNVVTIKCHKRIYIIIRLYYMILLVGHEGKANPLSSNKTS